MFQQVNKTVLSMAGTIEFEDYDAGGEGKAYHDTTLANEGGATYRRDAVDIEQNAGAGGLVVGYCRQSEWLQYTVNVTTAQTYDAYFKVASEEFGDVLTDSPWMA